MANKIQFKRGLKSKLPTVLAAGEPAYTTDTREFFVGTGKSCVSISGSRWYTGIYLTGTNPSSSYYFSTCPQVKVGDMYIHTSTGCIYQCNTAGSGSEALWSYKGCIKGAKGDKGEKGAKGDGVSKLDLLLDVCRITNNITTGIREIDTSNAIGENMINDAVYTDTLYVVKNAKNSFSIVHDGTAFGCVYDMNGRDVVIQEGESAYLYCSSITPMGDEEWQYTVLKKF